MPIDKTPNEPVEMEFVAYVGHATMGIRGIFPICEILLRDITRLYLSVIRKGGENGRQIDRFDINEFDIFLRYP